MVKKLGMTYGPVGIETMVVKSIDRNVKLIKCLDFVYDQSLEGIDHVYRGRNQKNNVPPHLKRCSLIGTCFLDAREFIHTLKCVVFFQNSRHKNSSLNTDIWHIRGVTVDIQYGKGSVVRK